MEFQRIRVRADGYDATGAYWGAGPDVFIAALHGGTQEITVRATTVTQAREKVAAELARAPGDPRREPPDAIGGASPNRTRYEINWRDQVTAATLRVRITHSRDYLGMGQDHVEVESVAPKRAPLPITDTGYRSYFLPPLELLNAGGPATFVTAALDREAATKDWQKRQTRRQQGDLFQWAEAQAEVGKPRRSPKPKRIPATRTTPRRQNRDPA